MVETLSTNDQLATYTKTLNQFLETIIAKAKTKLENNPLLFSLKSNGLFSSFVFYFKFRARDAVIFGENRGGLERIARYELLQSFV